MLMTSYSEGMYIKRLDLTNSVVGYFEFYVISHSKLFLLKLLFSHLISAISNYFSFSLRVRNSRIQLYLPNNLGLTRFFCVENPRLKSFKWETAVQHQFVYYALYGF